MKKIPDAIINMIFFLKCSFGYSIVLVSDLNQNSDFGRTLQTALAMLLSFCR